MNGNVAKTAIRPSIAASRGPEQAAVVGTGDAGLGPDGVKGAKSTVRGLLDVAPVWYGQKQEKTLWSSATI